MRTSSLFPQGRAVSPLASMRSTAMSVAGSLPTSSASKDRLSLRPTSMASAPSMTWWLVTISPASDRMTPLPDPRWMFEGPGMPKNWPHPPVVAIVWAVRTWTTASNAASAAALNPSAGNAAGAGREGDTGDGAAGAGCNASMTGKGGVSSRARGWAGWNWRTIHPPTAADRRERRIVRMFIQRLCYAEVTPRPPDQLRRPS